MRGRQYLAIIVVSTSVAGCVTVEYSAPDLSVPVLVGPVRPEPARCIETRNTPFSASTFYVVSGSSSGNDYARQSEIREARSTTAMVTHALEGASGLCDGCWVGLDRMEATDFFSMLGVFSTSIWAEGEVTHVISGDGGQSCDDGR